MGQSHFVMAMDNRTVFLGVGQIGPVHQPLHHILGHLRCRTRSENNLVPLGQHPRSALAYAPSLSATPTAATSTAAGRDQAGAGWAVRMNVRRLA
jgi:hypothetical protein